MNNSLIGDLRFVIGVFFGLVAAILLTMGLSPSEAGPMALGANLNLIAGLGMGVFALFMLTSSLMTYNRLKNAPPESLSAPKKTGPGLDSQERGIPPRAAK